jgi:precorrin-6A/cobalt-precorrin-6A reductase
MSAAILILGGTTEAVQLAAALSEQRPDLDLTIALAGATENPAEVPCRVRVGSFGGTEGLTEFLRHQGISAVIDATHPFAAQITRNADLACQAANVPCLHLDRPAWSLPEDTDVVFVPDALEAARLVARTSGAAFITIGRKHLDAFNGLANVHLVVRLLEPAVPPDDPPGSLENTTFVYGRPPFTMEDEVALMRAHKIDTLVSKASGGEATRSKIDAAALIGARIVLIRRPPVTDGERVYSIAAVVQWLSDHIKA